MSNKPKEYRAYEYTGDSLVYSIIEVDEILAEKDKEIAELKAKLDRAIAERDGNQVCIDALKQKLESVQASMYCDVVDANMDNRRLKRALWLARAYRAKEMCQRLLIQGFDPKWEEVERKCLKKAEEYK